MSPRSIAPTAARFSLKLAGYLCVVTILVVACGSGEQRRQGTAHGGASADSRLPVESLRDWVSYADAVALTRVISDEPRPVGDIEKKTGEGLVGRDVTVSVEEVIWHRPGGPEIPSSFTFQTSGWSYKDGRTVPINFFEPRLVVGTTYLMPIVRFSESWSETGATSYYTKASGLRAPTDDLSFPWAKALEGKSTKEIAQVLETTKPYPLAKELASADPEERYRAVEKERTGADPRPKLDQTTRPTGSASD